MAPKVDFDVEVKVDDDSKELGYVKGTITYNELALLYRKVLRATLVRLEAAFWTTLRIVRKIFKIGFVALVVNCSFNCSSWWILNAFAMQIIFVSSSKIRIPIKITEENKHLNNRNIASYNLRLDCMSLNILTLKDTTFNCYILNFKVYL